MVCQGSEKEARRNQCLALRRKDYIVLLCILSDTADEAVNEAWAAGFLIKKRECQIKFRASLLPINLCVLVITNTSDSRD
jgi:hypothetical protein